MPTYRKSYAFDAPKEVLQSALQMQLMSSKWDIIRQEPDSLFVKAPGAEPYDKTTYIGPTQMEIVLIVLLDKTKITYVANNEYYGDDTGVYGKIYSRMAQTTLEAAVMFINNAVSGQAKDWLAKQRYKQAQEQNRLPQPNDVSNNLSVQEFIAQLERLTNLHRIGALTDEQFEQAKQHVLQSTEQI